MKEEKQKRRIIYMTDSQWKELGNTAKRDKTTRSALIRYAVEIVEYSKANKLTQRNRGGNSTIDKPTGRRYSKYRRFFERRIGRYIT